MTKKATWLGSVFGHMEKAVAKKNEVKPLVGTVICRKTGSNHEWKGLHQA